MIVQEIYARYYTPRNLQIHMLRTAACGSLILAAWTGQALDQTAIIQTLLFHDIAKPVTFDITKQAQFIKSQSELKQVEQNIRFLIDHFGTNEHQATLQIFREIGLSDVSQQLVDNLEWHYVDQLIAENDLASLIPIYCDMRIGPRGILSIRDRIVELNARVPVENLAARLRSAQHLEDLMAKNVSTDLANITTAQIDSFTGSLSQKEVSV